MNDATPFDDLEKVSLHELWRLHTSIARAMEDPRKIEAVRARLRVGQSIVYFDARENRDIAGRVVEIRRSRVLVRHDEDRKQWSIPFYMIKLEGTGVDLHGVHSHRKIHRDSIRVGGSVGYVSREGRQVYGVVEKLNHKTATVVLSNGDKWRVAYGLLFHVLDVSADQRDEMERVLSERIQEYGHELENSVREPE